MRYIRVGEYIPDNYYYYDVSSVNLLVDFVSLFSVA